MALNTPTIRQLIQTRSHLAGAPIRDSLAYSLSDASTSDSPSVYSRSEFTPVLPAAPQLHRKPPPKYISTQSPIDECGPPMSDNSSIYSVERALSGFLPDGRSGYSEGRSPAEEYPDRKITGSRSGWFSDADAEGEMEDDESFITAHVTTPAPTPLPLPSMAAPTPKPRSPLPPPTRPPQSPPPPPPVSQTSPTSLSPPTSPPLTASPRLSTYNSHMSAMHLGPKMTFLSPAPWEDDESALANDSSDEEGEPRSRSSSFAGGRKRKISEDGRRPRQRTVSAARERDGRELKGLGLMHPSPAKASTTTVHTTTTTSSSSSGGSVPLIKTRSKSRSRPGSPVTSQTAVLALPLPPTAAAPRSPKPTQKSLTNKFSLPRLRHAFQAQSATSSMNGKPLPLPSPSTASFTSSLASPSPMEADFPRTPTSTSASSLKPYGIHSSPNNSASKSSAEQKRSVTLPDSGGNGMVLISLEQAQAQARRQMTAPSPGLQGRSSSGENLRESVGSVAKGEKVVKQKRSGFLRLFNGSPNPANPSGSGQRSESEVPPVPALPAAFISMPVTPNLAASTPSPRGSPPDHTPFLPNFSGQPSPNSAPSTIRERRQAHPSPPLEVNVLISRASGSDPSIVGTAASEPGVARGGLEPGGWQGQSVSLDVPRTPRTPAPKPLTLRPVSTMFSASFAGLIGDSPGTASGSGSSAGPSRTASPRSPPSSTSSPPPVHPRNTHAHAQTQAQVHSRSRTQSGQSQRSSSEQQQQAALIASLQAQIATSKQAWRKRVEELEGEVDGLRREVGRLEGMLVARRSGEEMCEVCGRG